VDRELLAHGAQAATDERLLELAQRCHPETLRQVRWANAMLKELVPQTLTNRYTEFCWPAVCRRAPHTIRRF